MTLLICGKNLWSFPIFISTTFSFEQKLTKIFTTRYTIQYKLLEKSMSLGVFYMDLSQTIERFFEPPKENNGSMTTSFELGGLPTILSDLWCHIVRRLHLAPTPCGQSLEFVKNGLKMLISLENMSFLSKKHDFLLQKLNVLELCVSYSKSLMKMKQA